MKHLLTQLFLATAAAASAVPAPEPEAQYFFENPSQPSASGYRIPTSRESAVMARRILRLTPLGTLSTVFPAGGHDGGLGGVPVGLMDYIADCEGGGDPTILAIKIATSFRNVAAGSNISLSMRWAPPHPPDRRLGLWARLFGGGAAAGEGREAVPYSAANLPRFSLVGRLEKMEFGSDAEYRRVTKCFTTTHRDARYWLPGNRIHESEFVRLVVTRVYWIGGFGDRAYIGWIPVDEWKGVTEEDVEGIRLPGEKSGWDEWSVLDL
jgi:hypothetical protein